MEKRLSELELNEQATIVSIGASELRSKLLEMGMVQNTQVSLVLRAPFNGSLAFDINGYTLSLRKDEADLVTVKPIA